MEIKENSVIIYENHKCLVLERSNTEVVLKNLDYKDESDWKILKIKLNELNN
jgi:hypothetical protein